MLLQSFMGETGEAMPSLRAVSDRIPNKKQFWVFVFGLLLVALGIYLVHALQPNTSDDVAIQTVFSQHLKLHGRPGRAWLGEDNYMLKVPFYLLMGQLFANSRGALLATAVIFNCLGFALFFYSSYYFYKKLRAEDGLLHMSLLWLVSISGFYLILFTINPNQRNVEIGLYFFILTLFARYIDQKISFEGRKRFLAALLLAIFGLFLYSDPFFVFMLVIPLLLLFGGYLYFQAFQRRMLHSSLFLIASLGISSVWKVVFEHFGIMTRKPQVHFILFEQLGPNLVKAWRAYFYFFSAGFWGKNALSLGTLRVLLNAFIMALVFIAPAFIWWQRKKKRLDPWLLFWFTQPVYITTVFVMSNTTVLNGDGSFRFLVLVPFFAPLMLALFVREIRNRRLRTLLVAIVVAATVLNVGLTFKTAIQQISGRPYDPNRLQQLTIRAVQKQGLEKGFGSYWDSNINIYLSGGKVVVIPANCADVQHFLMDDKDLHISAHRSFYIYNPTNVQHCSEDKLAQTLGQPSKVVPIEDGVRLFIYNYDITTKMKTGYYY